MRQLISRFGILVALTVCGGACGEPSTDDSTQSQSLGHGGDDDGDRGATCDAAHQAAQSSKPHKVTICHIPPGNPDNAHTINISKKALRAHLAHGDQLDGCGCADGGDEPLEPDDSDDDNGDGSTGDNPPSDPTELEQPDGGGATADPTPGDATLCDVDQSPCAQDAECGNNQACDTTSHCCVGVFL